MYVCTCDSYYCMYVCLLVHVIMIIIILHYAMHDIYCNYITTQILCYKLPYTHQHPNTRSYVHSSPCTAIIVEQHIICLVYHQLCVCVYSYYPLSSNICFC